MGLHFVLLDRFAVKGFCARPDFIMFDPTQCPCKEENP